MRSLFGSMLLLAAMAILLTGVEAGDKGAVKLKGTITCAKCDLKLQKKCATVIVTKEKGKDVVYYFDPASNKQYHKNICTEAKEGTVEGTVKTEGDKKIVTPSKVTFK